MGERLLANPAGEGRASRAHLLRETEETLGRDHPVKQVDHARRGEPVHALGTEGRETVAHAAPEERTEVGAGELHVLATVDPVVVVLHRAEQVADGLRAEIGGQIFLAHRVVRGPVVAGPPVARHGRGQLPLQRSLVPEVGLAHRLGDGRVRRGSRRSDRGDRGRHGGRGDRGCDERGRVGRRHRRRDSRGKRGRVARRNLNARRSGNPARGRRDTETQQLGLQTPRRDEPPAVHAQLAHALPDLLEANEDAAGTVLPVHRSGGCLRERARKPVTKALGDARIARPEPGRLARRRAQRVRAQRVRVQAHHVRAQIRRRVGRVLHRKREGREVVRQHLRHLSPRKDDAVRRAGPGADEESVSVVHEVGDREGSKRTGEGLRDALDVGVSQCHARLQTRT